MVKYALTFSKVAKKNQPVIPYLENFTLTDIDISCEKPGNIRYTKNWIFKNVSITGTNGQNLVREDNIDLIASKSKL